MGVTYAQAPAIIRARVAVIYGTRTHLARQLGISRQALNKRVTSAGGSLFLHDWWEALLGLRRGSLAAGEEPREDLDPIRAAVALRNAVEAWPMVYAGRHYFPSEKRLEANARRRGPRAKREAQGGAQ